MTLKKIQWFSTQFNSKKMLHASKVFLEPLFELHEAFLKLLTDTQSVQSDMDNEVDNIQFSAPLGNRSPVAWPRPSTTKITQLAHKIHPSLRNEKILGPTVTSCQSCPCLQCLQCVFSYPSTNWTNLMFATELHIHTSGNSDCLRLAATFWLAKVALCYTSLHFYGVSMQCIRPQHYELSTPSAFRTLTETISCARTCAKPSSQWEFSASNSKNSISIKAFLQNPQILARLNVPWKGEKANNASLGRLGWLGLRTCRKSCKSSWAFKQCKGGKSKWCNSETLDNCTNAMLVEDFWQSKWLKTLASCEFARLKASTSPLVSMKTMPLLF